MPLGGTEMKMTLGTLALVALSAAARAEPVIIIDGDTIVVEGDKVRIQEIDTPETFRSRCENELVLGLQAKQHLRELLDSGPVEIEPSGVDYFGRLLASVHAGNVNVGERMIEDGYALPYHKSKASRLERLRTWCGPFAKLSDSWKKRKRMH